jgi:hypothetical protein
MFFYETEEEWASQSFKDMNHNRDIMTTCFLASQETRNKINADFLVKLVNRLLVHLGGNPIPRGKAEIQINTRIVVKAAKDKAANNIKR